SGDWSSDVCSSDLAFTRLRWSRFATEPANQKRGCVRARATQLVRSYAPFLISYPTPMSARVYRGAACLGPESAEYHAAVALPNYQRAPDCFLLRGRTLHCRQGRGNCPPNHQRTRLYFFPAFLARWDAARLHLPIRRQYRSLCHAG